ncbi:MAG: hypothetical protein WBA23_13425, partial [Tunicatimonas sp.]
MKYPRTTVSRKDFLKLLGLGTAAATVPITSSMAAVDTATVDTAAVNTASVPMHNVDQALTLGLASYTLRSLSLDDALKVAKRLKLNHIALKSMHL